MSNDEQIPAVAEVENAKLSDGTSTAGEVSVDKVNDDEQVPQSDDKSSSSNDKEQETTVNDTVEDKADEDKNANNSNKRDIDQVEEHEETKNGHQESGEDADEAVVSTTSNKKAKVLHASGDDEGSASTSGTDQEENLSNTAKVPNEELTVV